MAIEFINVKDIKNDNNFKSEISYEEWYFIYSLLNKYKPKKIVEVGVAAGGTTSLMAKNTLPETCIYAIDIMQKYYREPNKNVGYMIDECCDEIELNKITRYFGEDIIYHIDEIGKDIDFCFLDTMHVLPGEILSFLAIYKYLSPNAIICMHDITLNMTYANSRDNITEYAKNAFATTVLFNTITSNLKFLPNLRLPNIGAVQIDETTDKNIYSIFLALYYKWHYYPEEFILDYIPFIKSNYDNFCFEIFKNAVWLQKRLV